MGVIHKHAQRRRAALTLGALSIASITGPSHAASVLPVPVDACRSPLSPAR